MRQEASCFCSSILFFLFMPKNCPYSLVIIPLGASYLLSFCLWAHVRVICLLGFFLLLFIFVPRKPLLLNFPLCLFLFMVDDTHILGHVSFIPSTFDHFASQLALMGLVVKFCKCVTWSLSNLPLDFSPPHGFCCLLNNIRVLGVPFVLCHYLLAFYRTFWRRKFVMQCAFKFRGCPNCFQDFISMFCAETVFSALCFLAIPKLLALACFLQFGPHVGV